MAIVTATTLGDFRTRIIRRLNDKSYSFWLMEELNDYINEAIFTFQSISHYKIRQISEAISIGQWNLDLNTKIPNGYSDNQLESAVRPVLFENTDTQHFDDFTSIFNSAKNKVRRLFQEQTGLTVNYRRLNANTGFIDLGVNHIRPIHIEWKGSGSSRYRRLNPESLDGMFVANYPDLGIPHSYVVNAQDNKQLEILPHPESLGDIDLFEVSASSNIPPNVRWILKYMVLDQFFSTDGQARDLVRSEYTKQRIEDGLKIANSLPLYRNFYVNNVPVYVTSLADLSGQETQWRTATGKIKTVALAGWNYAIFNKIPTTGCDLTVSFVDQLTELVDDSELLPFPEEFDLVLEDFVIHLAMLKVSGSEFAATFPFYKQLIAKAMDYNKYLAPLVPYLNVELGKAKREERDREKKVDNDQN